MAQLNLWPNLKDLLTAAWNLMAWTTGILAAYRVVFLSPAVTRLQLSGETLTKNLSGCKTVLDGVHYQDADSDIWMEQAKQATRACTAFRMDEEFLENERKRAWNETESEYSSLFRKG